MTAREDPERGDQSLAFDPNQTLEQLEGVTWDEPETPTSLVATCHRLRHKPLRDFTAEDLRVLIGQGISLPHLVPFALGWLKQNPLAEGDYYPGDLLHSVLSVGSPFWQEYPSLVPFVRDVVYQAQHRSGWSRVPEALRQAAEAWT